MSLKDDIYKEILLRRGYVTEENITAAEDFEKRRAGTALQYLLLQNLITKDIIGQAVAEELGVPYADLNSNLPSGEQVRKFPESLARKYMTVIFKETPEEVTVSTSAPHQPGLAKSLAQLFVSMGIDKLIKIAYSLPEDIEAAFVHYRESLEARFVKIIKDEKRVAPEIIDEIFEDAILYRVSDVHFEPQENKEVAVRFRIDGLLREVGRIPNEYYENILNRIKVQSHMQIDDHFSAQDGAVHYDKKNASLDARVSVVPTLDGEKIAIRILSEYVRKLSLSDLGLTEGNQKLLKSAASKSFGMIIISGATGSGKTTTLYALLKSINSPEINITTIEDPVEYKIEGINQIQVNPGTNLTFSKGLKSIARQDPDIILVGEIRDEETAEIAVNAALTGHLLFSTFHANDAATSIPRLLDMGIEPFLLSSTLRLIVAQRLVRKICESCRVSFTLPKEEINPQIRDYFKGEATVYHGKGCSVCGFTGYNGRTAIFEFIDITPEMQELILKRPANREIWALAESQGAKSIFEDGMKKVVAGITTLEELMRVAEPRTAII